MFVWSNVKVDKAFEKMEPYLADDYQNLAYMDRLGEKESISRETNGTFHEHGAHAQSIVCFPTFGLLILKDQRPTTHI